MDDDALIEAVSGDLFAYVLNGRLPADDVADLIKPEDFPEQYADFDRLVSLHFLLRDSVATFVDTLRHEIRTIKTETQRESNVKRGGIDGRINWEATYQARATTSPRDGSLHVVESQAEQYGIPENLVLKALVSVIDEAFGDVDRYLNANRSWVEDSWLSDQRQRERFQTLIDRNIHLQRIPDPSGAEPTSRMIARAVESRNELYRTAGRLLSERRSYDSSTDALRSLLQETAITPDGSQTLFELYVLFRVLDGLREVGGPAIGTPTYHTLASGRTAAAEFDGQRGLNVYYNQTPDGYDFTALPEGKDPVSRSDFASREAIDVMDAYFTDTNVRTHTGRPDVMITADDGAAMEERVLVVEVKHSTNKQTIRGGIRELVEYLSYLREEGEYGFAEGEFGSGLNGLLVVQDLNNVDFKPASLVEQSKRDVSVRIVQASDLKTILPSLVRRLFC